MRAMFDSLEGRQLFSVGFNSGVVASVVPDTSSLRLTTDNLASRFSVVSTFKVSKTGTLFVSGTGKADKLTVVVKNGRLVDSRFAVLVSDGGTTLRVTTPGASGTKIKRIDVSGLGGSDVITVIADVPVNVRGAAGSDTLNVFAPQRTIEGGSGANTIREGNEAAGDAYRPSTTIGLSPTYEFRSPLSTDYIAANPIFTPVYVAPVTVDNTKKPTRTSPRGG